MVSPDLLDLVGLLALGAASALQLGLAVILYFQVHADPVEGCL